MNTEKEELIAAIRQRIAQKGGNTADAFYQTVREDPLLLKDLFQTFSGNRIIDVMLDETCQYADHIGLWVRRKGDSLPTYAEIYAAEDLLIETKEAVCTNNWS